MSSVLERQILYFCRGKLPEWSIGADSKSVEPFEVPGVRIPHFPQKPYFGFKNKTHT
jgi:hypothetical protein